jgi:small-conductance mechanosensitive channel
MNLQDIFDSTLLEFKGVELKLSSILLALAIIIATWMLLYILKRVLLRSKDAQGKPFARNFTLYLLIKYFLWVIAIGLVLETMGIKLTILIASSAALMVGLGLGLQQTFNDIVSGVILLMERSVNIGDVMEVEGLIGKVVDMHLRTSRIQTRDGIFIIVPNHKFINEKVINWSQNAVAIRFNILVGVSYKSDVEKVRKVLYQCVNSHPEVILNNNEIKPIVRLIDFGDSSIDFEVLFWSKNIFYIENTKSELRFAIRKAFIETGIEIPFPQRDLHIKDQPGND